jgi:hypothetical protein
MRTNIQENMEFTVSSWIFKNMCIFKNEFSKMAVQKYGIYGFFVDFHVFKHLLGDASDGKS